MRPLAPLAALIVVAGLSACSAPATTVTAPATTAPTGSVSASTAPASSAPATSAAATQASSASSKAASPSTPASDANAGPTDPAFCGNDDVTVKLNVAEGDETRMEASINVTNKGSRACKLTGYPEVWFANNPSAPPVGAKAGRSADAPAEVTLAPGATAKAKLDVKNGAQIGCTQVPATGVRIQLPSRGDFSTWQPLRSTACQEATTQLLTVSPFVLG